MRRIMMISLILLACTVCQGQKKHRCITWMDLSSVLRSKEVDMFYGISVNERWSVCGAVSISISQASEEKINAGISAQYWTRETFDGPMVSFGLSDSGSIGCPVSLGYMCRIGKGMKVMLSYEDELIGHILNGIPSGKGICVSVGYEF